MLPQGIECKMANIFRVFYILRFISTKCEKQVRYSQFLHEATGHYSAQKLGRDEEEYSEPRQTFHGTKNEVFH